MPVGVRHKVNVKIPGLKKAVPYLAEELRRAANVVGERLQANVREKQRIDTGEERRRTLYRITTRKGGLNVQLSVYNTSIQGAVDETGARPHFPPYRAGSKLFAWVLRKGLSPQLGGGQSRAIAARVRSDAREAGLGADEARAAGRQAVADTSARLRRMAEGVSFVIARAISRRGLPRPGDPLRKPFETARRESDNMIRTVFNFAALKAVKRVNDEGGRG